MTHFHLLLALVLAPFAGYLGLGWALLLAGKDRPKPFVAAIAAPICAGMVLLLGSFCLEIAVNQPLALLVALCSIPCGYLMAREHKSF